MSTDTVKTLIITMESGVSEEYIDNFMITGIKCMRGVLRVSKSLSNPDDYYAIENAKQQMRKKLFSCLD